MIPTPFVEFLRKETAFAPAEIGRILANWASFADQHFDFSESSYEQFVEECYIVLLCSYQVAA